MESVIQGRAYKFGDNINSDIIIPGRYLIYIDAQKLSEHAFEVLGPEFPAKLRNFQILVAGRNFGCGSAREQAATAIQGLGIKAVMACSFARTFYRNAINDGLPDHRMSRSVPGGGRRRRDGIDLAAGKILHRGKEYGFPQLPESVRKILELGGLAAYLKTQLS